MVRVVSHAGSIDSKSLSPRLKSSIKENWSLHFFCKQVNLKCNFFIILSYFSIFLFKTIYSTLSPSQCSFEFSISYSSSLFCVRSLLPSSLLSLCLTSMSRISNLYFWHRFLWFSKSFAILSNFFSLSLELSTYFSWTSVMARRSIVMLRFSWISDRRFSWSWWHSLLDLSFSSLSRIIWLDCSYIFISYLAVSCFKLSV